MMKAGWKGGMSCAAVLAVWLCACAPAGPEAEPVVRPVVTALVQDIGTQRTRSFSGVTRAVVETVLSFRVGGEIQSLPIRIGMPVRKGQVMARLDTTDYALQVEQIEAQLLQAEAHRKQAEGEYERVRLLYESENASKSELDNARAAFESTRAEYEAVARQLEMARQQLEYCTLKAPMDGAVASKPASLHETVSPGQPVATLTSDGNLHLEAGVPESLIARVSVGDPATVLLEALPGVRFEARVSEVGIEPTPSSTYPVKLLLQTADERIRPGMIGEALLAFESSGPRIVVPPESVVGASGGERYVWVFDEARGRVSQRPVEVGPLTSEGLTIAGGLEPGERIVTRGVHRLIEGMRVERLPEQQQ